MVQVLEVRDLFITFDPTSLLVTSEAEVRTSTRRLVGISKEIGQTASLQKRWIEAEDDIIPFKRNIERKCSNKNALKHYHSSAETIKLGHLHIVLPMTHSKCSTDIQQQWATEVELNK